MHVVNAENRKQVFLELTPTAARCILDSLSDEKSLRGTRVKVTRGKGDKARLQVQVVGRLSDDAKLPEGKDPYQTLSALWGLNPADLNPGERFGDDLNGEF